MSSYFPKGVNSQISKVVQDDNLRTSEKDQLKFDAKVQDKINSIYGPSAQSTAGDITTVMGNLRADIGKNVADADYANQTAGRDRGIMNAKAGLSGTSTAGMDEQSRRNAIYGAAGINEKARRDATQNLGKATGNIITGMNKIENQAIANKLAAQGVAMPPEQTGLFGGTGFLGLG